MDRVYAELGHLQPLAARWLARHSISLLRISLGLVFLGFGALKFFPGASPAEGLAQETVGELTFGLVSERAGLLLVAALETAIGVCLLTGKFRRLGLALLGLTMVGILSPLVLVPHELFARHVGVPAYVPTLAGQYVLKDIVLLAAALVIAGCILSRHVDDDHAGRAPRPAAPADTCACQGRGQETLASGPQSPEGRGARAERDVVGTATRR